MARLLGPDEAYRIVYLTNGTVRAQGKTVRVWADEAATAAADLLTVGGQAVPVVDGAAQLTVDGYSKIPRFQFPDGVDVVYVSVNGGPVVPVYADQDTRVDALTARVTAVEAGGAGDTLLVHRAGAETITGVKTFSVAPIVPTPSGATEAASKGYADGVGTAVTNAAAADATTKANAAQAAAAAALTAHNNDTTAVHGIPDTQILARGAATLRPIVPLYVYPATAGVGTDWEDMWDTPPGGGMVIANPNTGPGLITNSDYAAAIAASQAAGMRVLGYVSLDSGGGPGSRAQATVTADIDLWHTLYPGIDGVFLDVAPTGANGDKIAYFAAVCAHGRAAGGGGQVVVVNPGTHPLTDDYVAPADIVCTWEGDLVGNSYLAATVPGYAEAWYHAHPASKYCHLVYGVDDAAEAQQVADHCAALGARWCYTTQAPASSWNALATYWTQQVAILQAARVKVDPLDRRAHVGRLTTAEVAGVQPLDADLTTIAALAPADDTVMQRKAGAWAARTPAQVKTDLVLVKGDVGLGNVDNTSDASKPVSTAAQTALNAKLTAASNLSDVANAGTSRTNLGLGDSATRAVGTGAGQVLSADTIDAKGDLLAGTAADTAARLAVGSSGRLLMADAAAASGLSYAAAGLSDVITSGEFCMDRRHATNNNLTMGGSGWMHFMGWTADKTETVATVTTYTGSVAAGATPTLCRVGIYEVDALGNMTLVASIANDTTLWSVVFTPYQRTLSSAWSKVAGRRYAFATLIVSGAAMPQMQGALYGATGTMSTIMGVLPMGTSSLTGQADLPASVAVGSLTANRVALLGRMQT